MSASNPVVRGWTPNEAWLFAELARLALVVHGEDGGGARIGVEATAASVDLAIELDGRSAEIVLDLARLDPVGRASWREVWVVRIEVADSTEGWELHPGVPVRVEAPPDRRLIGRLLVRWRALRSPFDGGAPIRVSDVAFHKYTRQSTAREMERSPRAWMSPTEPEPSPHWEIDLGKALFVRTVRLVLVACAPGTIARVTSYAYASPAGEPPPSAPVVELEVGGAAPEEVGPSLRHDLSTVARFVRVELRRRDGEPVSLHLASVELWASEITTGSLRETRRRPFALFEDRPLFVEVRRRGDAGPPTDEPTWTYRAAREAFVALARALAARLERVPRSERVFVALATENRPEWVLAELAAIERNYVTVPLAPDEPVDRLARILAVCPITFAVCSADQAPRWREVAARTPSLELLVVCGSPAHGAACGPDEITFEALVAEGTADNGPIEPALELAPDALHTILFTSGSGGAPKGAMRDHGTFEAMLASYAVLQPARHLSFQPLSHLSERMYLPAVIGAGGVIAFSRGGATLLEDLRAFEPTAVGSVPRLFEVLYASYRRRVREAELATPEKPRAEIEASALAEARLAFGRRLQGVGVGSAPVSAEVLAFMRRCFDDIWVSEGYGSTEVGTITTDGKIQADVDLKLVPEGADPDVESDRGEIWVRSPHRIMGYLGDPEASKHALTEDGYFRTGDLGERGPDGAVRVIGRLRNTVKLDNGEFLSCERVELALSTAPIVDRIFVHAAPGAAAAAAVVVPARDALDAALGGAGSSLADRVTSPRAEDAVLRALRTHGRAFGLQPYEIPRAALLEIEPFSRENGLLTPSGKLARAALAARYAERLDALSARGAQPVELDADPAPESPLVAALVRAAGRVLGRSIRATDALGDHFDSLSTAEMLAETSAALGRDLPLDAWFRSRTLEDLASQAERFTTTGLSPALDAASADVASPVPSARGLPAARWPPANILLTGATGFLGAHLIEALLSRTQARVTCLVRASSREAARGRLRAALDRYEVFAVPERVDAVAADLAEPSLGLDDEAFCALADGADLIVHAGAVVSWLAPYSSLRGGNVVGTLTLLELATSRRAVPFHFVSTISTAPATGDEASFLPFTRAAASSPYALSKWIAEHHVRRAGELGLPVTIYRPGMIAGHTARGHVNPDDFIARYLAGCAGAGRYIDRSDAVLDMTPVDYVAGAIAAVVASSPAAGATYHLANVDGSPTYAELGAALSGAGVEVRACDYATFRDALVRGGESPLRALASYFPADGFALGMGPWPAAWSRARIGELGVVPPRIDAEIIGRYVRALRARGLVAPIAHEVRPES